MSWQDVYEVVIGVVTTRIWMWCAGYRKGPRP